MKETKSLKKKFISIIESGNTITKACREIGIHRSTFYEWRQKDTDFAIELLHAQQNATDITNEIAGYHYHQRVRQGDHKFLMKWLDERHPEYAKKKLTIAFGFKDNRGNSVVQTLDKEELFERMRSVLNSGMVEMTDIPKDIELEFWDWYEQNYPGGPDNVMNPTKDYLNELWNKAYRRGVEIKRTKDKTRREEDI